MPENLPFADRNFDQEAVACFPWPAVAAYPDIHRWMGEGLAVHAAWQVRDAWEGFIKFLGVLAVADRLAGAEDGDSQVSRLLALLLKPRGLSVGDWPHLMELALKEVGPRAPRVPGLRELLFPARRPRLMRLFVGGDAGESFIPWRNRRFGHGVFAKDLGVFADEARQWLDRLHDAFDLCRDLLNHLRLESDDPAGRPVTWGDCSPREHYHRHLPEEGTSPLDGVRLRGKFWEGALDLGPLLSVQRCGVCGEWAAFYFDRYEPGKHRAWFFDFIVGHSHPRRDVGRLRRWSEQVRDEDAAARVAEPPDPSERREPDPERFRDFKSEFEPPVHLAEPVAVLMRSRDRGAVLFTGPGGCGKSWACQGLDHPAMLPALLGRTVPLLYASAAPNGSDELRPADVIARLEGTARRVKQWQVPPRPGGVAPPLSEWLRALMSGNALGELVVALDGWDELPSKSKAPALLPPASELPPRCYLVLASRPDLRQAAAEALAGLRIDRRAVREVTIGPTSRDHRRVLRAYAEKRLAQVRPDGGRLPAAWAEPLIDLAGGSFLYVFHYCRALRFGAYRDLRELPKPADYYPAFLAHLKGRVGEDLFETYYARVLVLVHLFSGGVSLSELASLGLERQRLVVVLDDLADFLRSERDAASDTTLYRPGHASIEAFLADDPDWQARQMRAREALAERVANQNPAEWLTADFTERLTEQLWSMVLLQLHTYLYVVGYQQQRAALGEQPLPAVEKPRQFDRLVCDVRFAHACLRFEEAQPLLSMALGPDTLAAMSVAGLLESYRRREPRSYTPQPYFNPETGELVETGDPWADANLSAAEQIHLTREPGRPELRRLLAVSYGIRAKRLEDAGRLGDAVAALNTGIDLLSALLSEPVSAENQAPTPVPTPSPPPPAEPARKTLLGWLLGWWKKGRAEGPAEAVVPGVPATAWEWQPIRRDGPGKAFSNWVELFRMRVALLQRLGRTEELIAGVDAGLRLAGEALCRGLMATRDHKRFHAELLQWKGAALAEAMRWDELADLFQMQVDLLVPQAGRPEARRLLALFSQRQGSFLGSCGRWDEALAAYTRAVEAWEGLRAEEVDHNSLLDACVGMAQALTQLDRLAEAVGVIRLLLDRGGVKSGRESVVRRLLDTMPNPPDHESVIALLGEVMEVRRASS